MYKQINKQNYCIINWYANEYEYYTYILIYADIW